MSRQTFLILSLLGLLYIGPSHAETFDQLCATVPGTDKFDPDHYINSDIINCWGFENETSTNSDMYIGWKSASPRDSKCADDPGIKSHPNYNMSGKSDGRNVPPLRNTTANYNEAHQKCYYPIVDDTLASSGSKSLKLRYPELMNNPGEFQPFFKVNKVNGQYEILQVGRGGEIWIRFSMRQDQNLLRYAWKQKRFIASAWSQSFNLEETLTASAATQTANPENLIPFMYSDSGNEHYAGDFGPFNRPQGQKSCASRFRDNKDQTLTEPCRLMVPNVFEVYEIQIVGATNANLDNGRVRLYVNGRLVMDVDDSDMGSLDLTQPYRLLQESGDTSWYQNNDGYSRMSFTLYSNHKNDDSQHPEAAMWIDDVIVSTKRMPAIDGTNVADLVAPDSPTELSVN